MTHRLTARSDRGAKTRRYCIRRVAGAIRARVPLAFAAAFLAGTGVLPAT